MQSELLDQLALPTASLVMREYLLAPLTDPMPAPLGGNTGLPHGALECLEHNLVVAVTPVTERQQMFDDALTRFAGSSGRDVVLIRHGFHPETLDPVRADVALRSVSGPLLVPDLSFWRGLDGALHLVPNKHDLHIELAGHGIDVSMTPPWNSWDERSDGLTRAAAEVVRAMRRARGGG